MHCLEVNKDNLDKNNEENIKNEENFSNALSVSIKCGLRENDAVYTHIMRKWGHKIFTEN